MIKTKAEYEDFVIKLLNIIISGMYPSEKDFPEFTEKDLARFFFNV